MDSKSKKIIAAATELINVAKMTHRELKENYSNIFVPGLDGEGVRNARRTVLFELTQVIVQEL